MFLADNGVIEKQREENDEHSNGGDIKCLPDFFEARSSINLSVRSDEA
jgi:hypothetical protein